MDVFVPVLLTAVYLAVFVAVVRAMRSEWLDYRESQRHREAAFLKEHSGGVGAGAPTVTPSPADDPRAVVCSPLGHPDLVPTSPPVDRFSHCDLCGRSEVHRTVWLDASCEEGLPGAFVDVCAGCYAQVMETRHGR